ncbi:hypothetical protein ACGGAQ_30225 [Micromonospora sp. NPDC047557]|uniref:hypothetical protein n=1 Tax=Micromonospora sp. NPDC047557 TaxID=3364250 RepID=UPI0037170E3E
MPRFRLRRADGPSTAATRASPAVGFGLDMSAEDQAVLLSFVGLVLGMFERT